MYLDEWTQSNDQEKYHFSVEIRMNVTSYQTMQKC